MPFTFLDAVRRQCGNPELPEGFDSWGMKTVDPLRRTKNGHFWPEIGGTTKANDNIYRGYLGMESPACPYRKGDGLTVATRAEVMNSGGLLAAAILLVAYKSGDVDGSEYGKVRTIGDVAVVGEVCGGLDLSGVDDPEKDSFFLTGGWYITIDDKTNVILTLSRASLALNGFGGGKVDLSARCSSIWCASDIALREVRALTCHLDNVRAREYYDAENCSEYNSGRVEVSPIKP